MQTPQLTNVGTFFYPIGEDTLEASSSISKKPQIIVSKSKGPLYYTLKDNPIEGVQILPSLIRHDQDISPKLPELSQEGRTVLITGGSGGIGLAIAKAFIAAKAKRVIILGRHVDKLDSATVELSKEAATTGSPTVAEARVCDISSLESTSSLWTRLRADEIVVDVLILNAAANGAMKPLLENGRDNILQDFNVNFRANIDFTEYLYKQEGQAVGGRKVVVGLSTLAIYQWNMVQDRPSYGLSKSAGTLVLQQLARAIQPDDMQISIVHPGVILTEGMKEAGGTESSYQFDSVDLPAHFVVWAASPQAEFLHGRFVWANWDVNELKSHAFRKQLEENPNLLTVGVEGLSESKNLPIV
ncbi:hypothetical protein NOF04DRAFT_11487 [Fusarium oxysporum II5]|uniref:Alcohol dehydrogenase n=1 Tax=Fusarium odoratissimum (strain NRRL 54006) TaxID=1089451 RepID=X0J042_FUSO5|nr:uncharacterized protein FOIG_12717 [Fusarium odoratissimum NRRL 54006]EXL94522.1 hypothetical protein FOIG_12717 [Fusarium odoratissimum NRRL 54006]KAK2122473.1 hypothetical protein NOF04DRAFT_11487 [Fusarium oxysporum II5]